MRGKEYMGIPEDAQFIRNEKGDIVGITIGDGSYDYAPEGQKFLAGKVSFRDLEQQLYCGNTRNKIQYRDERS